MNTVYNVQCYMLHSKCVCICILFHSQGCAIYSFGSGVTSSLGTESSAEFISNGGHVAIKYSGGTEGR